MLDLPTRLTLVRVAIIPVLLLLHSWDIFFLDVVCAVLFAIAAFTDFLDGYYARKLGKSSRLGALLDPISDKMLMAAGLVLVARGNALITILAVLLICRDIFVNGLRMAALQQQVSIEVNALGKVKTTVEDVAVFCLLINDTFLTIPFRTLGMLGLWLGLGLSLYSAWIYWEEFRRKVTGVFD